MSAPFDIAPLKALIAASDSGVAVHGYLKQLIKHVEDGQTAAAELAAIRARNGQAFGLKPGERM